MTVDVPLTSEDGGVVDEDVETAPARGRRHRLAAARNEAGLVTSVCCAITSSRFLHDPSRGFRATSAVDIGR
jgi:hypothetical protein